MATLVFTALGTLLGGPLGGALGALAGQQIDRAIIGGGHREGARLSDLSVTASSYGDAMPRHFGRMRVAGSIIWATDLAEHSSTSGGKGQPSVTTYSYSSSFAVALASREITGIGRIWADGNLLRGAAGDLKVGGIMRLYTGGLDQPADPLIAAAVGSGTCPAFRGIAYAVFEDLQLADFGNRIPALTFEVLADDGALSLARLFDGVIDDIDADVPLGGIAGYSCDGPLGDVLGQFQPVLPMICDAGGARLTITRARLQAVPIVLGPATVSADSGDFGGQAGFARNRAAADAAPVGVLRYYDVDRDFQPGAQRAPGRPLPGQPTTVELPAALTAGDAQALILDAARQSAWGRDTLAWRCAELDPAVAPGSIVVVPGQAGQWRVRDWEWQASGVALTLERVAPAGLAGTMAGSSGAPLLAGDLAGGATELVAFELPWDGTGSDGVPAIYAAASSAGAGWTGAELFVDAGDGALASLGTGGRARTTIGSAATMLAAASPLLIDRQNAVEVTLVAADLALAGASVAQLAAGANRALLGEEMIQFGRATALGAGRWRLSTLLRGRGGTEDAIGAHVSGEAFVLLDSAPLRVDAARIPAGDGVRIAALGLGDPAPVERAILDRGATLRPLAPVHGRAARLADGSLVLGWTRRARGAFLWREGVDVPLQEDAEAYELALGPLAAPIARWTVPAPQLTIVADALAGLPAGDLRVRQIGSYALSDPLLLTTLP